MDRYTTSLGDIDIGHLGCGSVAIICDMHVIYIDPYCKACDYKPLPKADLILITHDHLGHLDVNAINDIRKDDTYIIATDPAAAKLAGAEGISNGAKTKWNNIEIDAVPAYNIKNMRSPNEPFHPKGEGNGYILTINGIRIYIAGNTEVIPEMNGFGEIDIAFLPKNLPYAMNDEMFLEAANLLHPKILYPYRYSNVDHVELQRLLPFLRIR